MVRTGRRTARTTTRRRWAGWAGAGAREGGPPCFTEGPARPATWAGWGRRCRLPRRTARPGHGQQGGRVAGRSAVGRRCRPPVPPVLVAVFATFPPAMTGAGIAHNACYTQVFDRLPSGRSATQHAYNTPALCEPPPAAAIPAPGNSGHTCRLPVRPSFVGLA